MEERQAPSSLMHGGRRGAFAIAALIGGVSWAFRPYAGPHQPSTLVVTVVDSLARYPLVNADVIDLATGQHRFTDERGQAYLTWPSSGQLQIRVREVGYQPRQRTLHQGAGSAATFEMQLTVEQRIAAVPADSEKPRIIANIEKFRSDNYEARYQPGEIIEYSRGTFHVPILFLSTLADSTFWENHCFLASGGQTYQGAPIVRLDFSPRSALITADYEGSAYLDSATSSLRRVDFHLANLTDRRGPKRLEGYVTFMSPSPYVVVPDTTVAIWWVRNVRNGDWGKPDYVQRLSLQEVKYRGKKPPPK